MWIRVTRSIFHFRDWGISSQLCNSHTIRGDDICILYLVLYSVCGFVFVFVFPIVGVSLTNSWQCNYPARSKVTAEKRLLVLSVLFSLYFRNWGIKIIRCHEWWCQCILKNSFEAEQALGYVLKPKQSWIFSPTLMSEFYWKPKSSLISSNTSTPNVSSHAFPELRSSFQELFLSIEEVRVPFSLLFLAPLCCRGTAASLRNWWQFSSPLPLRRPPSQHTVHQRARPKIWNWQPLWDVFISIAPQTTTSPEHSPPEDKTIELTWWPIQRWEN